MPKQLDVHNAQITTATVEVKTLTISGKQVTLAVFRQLREEPLISDDGDLNGVPWGTVNYHPDKCADKPEHVHVVWQRGSELLRSAVPARVEHRRVWGDDADQLLTLCAYEVLVDGATWFGGEPLPEKTYPGSYGTERTYSLHGLEDVTVEAEASKAAAAACEAHYDLGRESSGWSEERKAEERTRRERMFQECLAALRAEVEAMNTTQKALHDRVAEKVKAELARRQRHVDARRAIAELPQLFIAV